MNGSPNEPTPFTKSLEIRRAAEGAVVGSYNIEMDRIRHNRYAKQKGVAIASSPLTADDHALPLSELVARAELGMRFVVNPEFASGNGDPVDKERTRERGVRWAHSTEAVDPSPHLRRDELVCTVGSSLRDDADCRRFAQAVLAASSAGICFGTGEVHARIPAALVNECQRLNLALVEMPHGAPFLAVNDVLADARETARGSRDDAVRERQRVGHLLTLIVDRLADPAALSPELAERRWGAAPITISVWEPGSSARLLALNPDAWIGDTPQFTYLLTTSRQPALDTAALTGSLCGCSSAVPLGQLARGIAEARAAFHLARSRGMSTGPESLTDLTGLLQQQPAEALDPFVDQLIAPLLAYDAARNGELLATLRIFIAHRGALQAAADETFLHVNTVRYRLRRVRTLVGRDPLQLDDYVAFSIALWAHDRMQHFRR
ncbi:MAG: PucR family transcriptional regulator [Microbacteriaceae bacterium]|nr:PucR family transcriptional regulator [Microbacteriaceae bacterium]